MGDMSSPLVEMRGICKRFGGVKALDHAGIVLYPGEIHALVGDNAAGKSTLIKILSGAIPMDSGNIYFEGRSVEIQEPRDAKALGIETVYQDLALADNLDVPGNIFLGRELLRPGLRGIFLDLKRMEAEARTLLARLKIHIASVRLRTRALSGGQRQSVAIARCMYFNARVVILDEPTAALGVAETAKVHELVRDLKNHGLAVLMISHNLNHVFGVSDRITVMKAGRIIGSRVVAATTQEEILRMILTGQATDGAERKDGAAAEPDFGGTVLPAHRADQHASPA